MDEFITDKEKNKMVIDDRKLSSQPPGKLFYAVILTDSPVDFGSIGLDNQRVFSVNYKDIAALVSDLRARSSS